MEFINYTVEKEILKFSIKYRDIKLYYVEINHKLKC